MSVLRTQVLAVRLEGLGLLSLQFREWSVKCEVAISLADFIRPCFLLISVYFPAA